MSGMNESVSGPFADWVAGQLTGRDQAHAMRDALLARAREQGAELRAFPPEPTSCCGRGCNGCVWEGWYDAVAYWRDEALLILG